MPSTHKRSPPRGFPAKQFLVGGKTTKIAIIYALPFEAAQCGNFELRQLADPTVIG